MIKTKRLNIKIASDDDMRKVISKENEDELKKAYSEMLELCIAHPEQRKWYALWFIELLNGERIGGLCFKGLSSNGTVEIGYGIFPEFFGKGYATEAIQAVTEWALKQYGVKMIKAETDAENIASQKVLLKSGFVLSEKNNEGNPEFVRYCSA